VLHPAEASNLAADQRVIPLGLVFPQKQTKGLTGAARTQPSQQPMRLHSLRLKTPDCWSTAGYFIALPWLPTILEKEGTAKNRPKMVPEL